jgi:UDP-glucose 4-epimerase
VETALVTGARGFIGQHVARHLEEQGHRVVPLLEGAESDELALSRLMALAVEPTLIVHCAGSASVGASMRDPYLDFNRTIPPIANLLEYLRRRCPRARLVLLSSAAVYGQQARMPLEEDRAPAPISPYGVHKRICEELSICHARNDGLAVAIIRLFSVYGPGLRKQLLWDACTKATAGERRFSGTGAELRDWLHVSDACALILAAAQAASSAAPIINGAVGVGVPVSTVVGRIFAELGAGQPQFDGTTRAGDPTNYVADVRATHGLGWQPQVTLDEGLAAYVRWFESTR